MISSDVAQGVDDAQVRGAVGGNDAADHSDNGSDQQNDEGGEGGHVHRDGQSDAGAGHGFDDQGSEENADQSSDQRNGDRFA